MQIMKSNVTQQVTEYLKENIDSGNWGVGEKIPSENQLTQLLGVSRASVRMAIQQLIGIGCLESIHGKGTFVIRSNVSSEGVGPKGIAPQDCQDLSKVLEFRLVVEPGVAQLAALNATAQNMDTLKMCLDTMKKNVGNSETFVKYDVLFHEEVCRATGNQLLEKCLSEIFMQKQRTHEQINEVFGYKDGIYYHTLLYNAIHARDGVKAKRIMKEHIKKALDELKL